MLERSEWWRGAFFGELIEMTFEAVGRTLGVQPYPAVGAVI